MVTSHFAYALRAAAGVMLAAGVLLAGCGSDGTGGPVGTSPSRDHLNEGEFLNLDESLTSPDGSTELRLGGASLQLYFNGQVIWSSAPIKFPSSAYFTPDMSFFVEGRDRGVSYWIDTSERARRAGAGVVLRVLDGGRAQIVSTNRDQTVLWENGQLSQRRNLIPGETLALGESLVSPDGRTRLSHQSTRRDYSRVAIYTDDREIWSSPEALRGKATLTTDGDFTLLNLGDPTFPQWSSDTSGFVRGRLHDLELVVRNGKVQLVSHKPGYGLLWENGQRKV